MKINTQWVELRRLLQSVSDTPNDWRQQDFDLFFESEFGLYVFEQIVP